MAYKRGLLVPIVLLCGTAFGLCEDDPGTGVVRGLITIKAQLSGFSENQKVSGTNVNFNAYSSVESAVPPGTPSPATIANARPDSYNVKIGGSEVYSWQIGQALPPGSPPPDTCSIRYASTHFGDESSIEIRLTTNWTLQTYAKAGSLDYDAGPLQVVRTMHVRAYNKGLAMHTAEVFDLNLQNYTIPNPNSGWDWDYTSPNASAAAISALTSMNHTLLSANGVLPKQIW